MAKVQAIAAVVVATLRDADADSWTASEIHSAINEAEKVIVNYRPDASAIDYELPCAEGIKQSLPANANRLLDVKFNVGAASAPGRSVHRKAVVDLDSINPNWRSASANAVIREFVYDDREPLFFYVYPPAANGAKLQISYSGIPPAYGTVDANTATLVSDLYEPAIIEWALYRLFGFDVENSVNMARSQQHLSNFANMLGVKLQNEPRFSPRNRENKA
tara:strand:- start:13 stop:669 length:657 start_codon:yes stop_codon:yes gene_type:complete